MFDQFDDVISLTYGSKLYKTDYKITLFHKI